MIVEVFMPKAGMAMEEGRLIRWLKEVGERVEMGEAIMEIETDKVTMEAESPGSGILLAKLIEDDTTVPVLATIGYLGEEGDKIPEQAQKAPEAPKTEAPEVKPVTSEATQPVQSVQATNGKTAATPNARRLAKENGISLESLTATGSRGEITGKDVLAGSKAVTAPSPEAPIEGQVVAMSGMRKVIAGRMISSHLEIPPVTQNMKVYVDDLMNFRAQLNAQPGFKITVNDFMIMAVARAASEFDAARTAIQGNSFIIRPEVNVGFAVGLDEGLLVPVIKDADTLSLASISAKAKELADKARNGKLHPDEYGNGVITISNMGMFDILSFTPIINQPESSIMGVCSIMEEAAFRNGTVVPVKTLVLSYTFDHRIMDGVTAARFQKRVKYLLENPMILCTLSPNR